MYFIFLFTIFPVSLAPSYFLIRKKKCFFQKIPSFLNFFRNTIMNAADDENITNYDTMNSSSFLELLNATSPPPIWTLNSKWAAVFLLFSPFFPPKIRSKISWLSYWNRRFLFGKHHQILRNLGKALLAFKYLKIPACLVIFF